MISAALSLVRETLLLDRGKRGEKRGQGERCARPRENSESRGFAMVGRIFTLTVTVIYYLLFVIYFFCLFIKITINPRVENNAVLICILYLTTQNSTGKVR